MRESSFRVETRLNLVFSREQRGHHPVVYTGCNGFDFEAIDVESISIS